MEVRRDLRSNDQIRALGCEIGPLCAANGSAKYWQGNSCVVVSVNGPMEVPIRKEMADRATIEVVFKPKIGLPGIAERRMESLIVHAASNIIVATQYPRSLITIVVQTLCDDGSLLSCAVNGVCLALIDSGIAMSTCIAATTCQTTVFGAPVVLDPIAEEESTSSSLITLGFLKEPASSLVLSHTIGAFSEEHFGEAWSVATAAAAKIFAFYRVTLERRLSKAQ